MSGSPTNFAFVRMGWCKNGFSLALPAIVLLTLFFVIPIAMLLVRSVTDPVLGLQNYAELLGSPSYRTVFLNTFRVSTVVTLVTLTLGFPVAWLMALLPGRWASIVFYIVVLSMWTNLLTRTFAWMVLLQNNGIINRGLIALGIIDHPLPLINNLTGVTIGMTYIMLPFLIMPLYASLSAMDRSVLCAASLCGANNWQVFRHVFLPICAPGIAAGSLMVFVMSLGYFVTPTLLGGTSNMMLAELISQLVQSMLNWGLGGAAAFILLTVTLALYWIQLKLFDPLSLGNRI